ncbi:MAG TPA: sulfatase-like hydrolase/transferase [Verrucomicrobiae bacterium]
MNTPETTVQPSEHTNAPAKPGSGNSRNVKDWIVALSMANWVFIRVWSNLLSGKGRFFSKLPVVRAELLALAACIIGMASLIWLGIGLWRRTSHRWMLSIAFLALLIFPVDYIRWELSLSGREVLVFAKNPAGMFCLLMIAGLAVWKLTHVARGLAVVAGITFPLALLNIAKIVFLSLNVIRPNDCECSSVAPPVFPVRQGQPRLVWTIFDETDYRLAFEQRPPNIKLAEFDRLQKESLSSVKAYPPGYETSLSMPALIAGRRFSSGQVVGCDLKLQTDDTGATVDWSASPSVFSRARGMGFNTGLVGWYLPYDRILGKDLNYCSWYSNPTLDPASSANFFESIGQQLGSLGGIFHARQLFIDACKGSLKDGLSAIANTNLSLVLLHLPPPHDPSVYLPARNEFSVTIPPTAASYFNNLALADHELGELRRSIETSKDGDNTWLIFSADHSWRKSKQYDGRRDYRVPFLIKAPHNGAPITYSRQINTLITGDLILAILSGEITNQSGVATWLDGHGKPDLPILKTGESVE